MHSFFFDILYGLYTRMETTAKNYEIIHAYMIYCTLQIWAVILLLFGGRTIINNIGVILHGFMLQIIYSTVFPS